MASDGSLGRVETRTNALKPTPEGLEGLWLALLREVIHRPAEAIDEYDLRCDLVNAVQRRAFARLVLTLSMDPRVLMERLRALGPVIVGAETGEVGEELRERLASTLVPDAEAEALERRSWGVARDPKVKGFNLPDRPVITLRADSPGRLMRGDVVAMPIAPDSLFIAASDELAERRFQASPWATQRASYNEAARWAAKDYLIVRDPAHARRMLTDPEYLARNCKRPIEPKASRGSPRGPRRSPSRPTCGA